MMIKRAISMFKNFMKNNHLSPMAEELDRDNDGVLDIEIPNPDPIRYQNFANKFWLPQDGSVAILLSDNKELGEHHLHFFAKERNYIEGIEDGFKVFHTETFNEEVNIVDSFTWNSDAFVIWIYLPSSRLIRGYAFDVDLSVYRTKDFYLIDNRDMTRNYLGSMLNSEGVFPIEDFN